MLNKKSKRDDSSVLTKVVLKAPSLGICVCK